MTLRQPPLFLAVGRKRRLWALAGVTLLAGAAMLPAMRTMTDHGASLFEFEKAGTAARSQEIVSEWGAAGMNAAWWQLALDLPFLLGYGLFLAGACTAGAQRAHVWRLGRLERAAIALAWFGPLAAAADLAQNVSLAFILTGSVNQPWPRISAVAGYTTTFLALAAAAFAALGAVATREPSGS
jgi:hypothetical protein